MKTIKNHTIILILLLPLLSFSQKVENIHFEQVGKQIHIYYDLHGDQDYKVKVFCSTDKGQSWGEPLKYVGGAVGEKQKPGKGKVIVWDVLVEKEKLAGNVRFKIDVSSTTGLFTDARDGQTYKWVKIGTQVWMAENLNYQTGNSWCYENKPGNCEEYGRLYEWKAAYSACPFGWHLPTDGEWKTLEMHLGMSRSEADDILLRGTNEGKKLKSTSGWYSGSNGINEVGFFALPSGYRGTGGTFNYLGRYGYWWLATTSNSYLAWYHSLSADDDKVYRNYDGKDNGYSVRCVKD